MVTLQTNYGDIVIELDMDKAPKTCENFIAYVKDGFYDGTIFHRVINGFMIQGGGFTEDMDQKSTNAAIENEANNGLKNTIGTLAMARTQDPHSATAQFFINVNDNDFLNFRSEDTQGWGYAVFGKVTDDSIGVVNKIKEVATGSKGMHQDVPLENIIITTATITE